MRRCSVATLAELRASPDRIGTFVAPDDDEAALRRDLISLDKAWHAIHFLLCGNTGLATGPQGSLFAGEELGEDFGYGSPRLLSVAETEAFADFLSSKPDTFVERNFDFGALEAADIYPDIWDRKDPEDIEYVAEYFRTMKAFVRTAADAGEAIFLLIL
jgi:hypothetical protein